MPSTNSDPKFLTDDERAILDVVRGCGLSLDKTCEAIGAAAIADRPPAPEPAARPRTIDPARAEARCLALAVARWAVKDLARSRKRLGTAERLYENSDARRGAGPSPLENSDEWQRYLDTCVFFARDAEVRVIAAVLMMAGRIEDPRDVDTLPKGFKPAALELDGTHYVVSPADEDDNRPVLIEVDEDAFDSCQFGNAS